ncbi:MAG: NAD(P)-dependent alcohol dehydrogenase [Thaumarchaeota archaeon]|nr:NAD(P)-dependent alcohol dehydrogenase [Nitrososphaerota archaeon]
MLDASTTGQGSKMKAVVRRRYGSPNVLEIEEVVIPVLEDDRVLVRVKASSVNALAKYSMRGPWIVRVSGEGLRRPKIVVQGTDLAGEVVSVGKNVTHFKPGDEVYGTGRGAYAEYASAREDRLALKPANQTFEQAAGVPIAAITALQGLRDKGQVREGQNVLIVGASGGVGTFAVQIAKALGAQVTAVCRTDKVEQTRSLGADRVIDYTKEDFAKDGQRYDLILDIAGDRSFSDIRHIMNPDGTLVLVGAYTKRRLGMTRALAHIAYSQLLNRFVSQKLTFFEAKINTGDLNVLKDLIESGEVSTLVDRTYPLNEVPDAIRYLEGWHAKGKIIITI